MFKGHIHTILLAFQCQKCHLAMTGWHSNVGNVATIPWYWQTNLWNVNLRILEYVVHMSWYLQFRVGDGMPFRMLPRIWCVSQTYNGIDMFRPGMSHPHDVLACETMEYHRPPMTLTISKWGLYGSWCILSYGELNVTGEPRYLLAFPSGGLSTCSYNIMTFNNSGMPLTIHY